MDNVTNLGAQGSQTQVLYNAAYYTGEALLNIIQILQTKPELMKQVGITNYQTGDLTNFYNQLDKFVSAFAMIQEKKVS